MGPDGEEYPFAQTFERIADGRIDVTKLVTGYAGLEGVEEVFAHLRPGNYRDIEHVKILVRHDIDGPGSVRLLTVTVQRRCEAARL